MFFEKTIRCLLSISYGFGIVCIANSMNITFKCDVVSIIKNKEIVQ